MRNTRHIGIPDVVKMAQICIEAGAKRITVHPRPDRRHIKPQDVYDLAQIVIEPIKFNLESTFKQYADAAKKAQQLGLGVNAGHDLNLENITNLSVFICYGLRIIFNPIT